MLLLKCGFLCFLTVVTIAAPTQRNNSEESDWSFSGISSRLSGRKGTNSETKTRTFGGGIFGSQSSSNGQDSDSDFDLESFVGIGKANRKDKNSRVPEDQRALPKKQVVVETGSSARVDMEEGASAGGMSGVAGAEDLETLDLDTFAGVNEKQGFSHSGSRAVGNAGSANNRRHGKTSQEQGEDDLSVAAVGASASVGKNGAANSRRNGGSSVFGDDFFVSSSLSSRKSGSNSSKVSGRGQGFGSDSGSFGITFEDDKE